MDAVVGDDREARHLVDDPVVADEGRLPRNLTLRRERLERCDDVLALGEVLERPEIDVLLRWIVRERRRDREPDDRDRDDRPDDSSDPERGELEELAPRVALGRLDSIDDLDLGFSREFRRDRRSRACAVARSRIADPEQAEDDRDTRADRDDPPVDDEADKDQRHAGGEAEREDRGCRQVRAGVLALLVLRAARPPPRRALPPASLSDTPTGATLSPAVDSSPAQPFAVNDVTVGTNDQTPCGAIRPAIGGSGRPRTSALPLLEGDAELRPATVDLIPDLERHLDPIRPRPRPLGLPLVRRVDSELAAEVRQNGRVIELVERTVREDDVTLRIGVRTDVEEDLLVVVNVHELVHHDDGLSRGSASRAPRWHASPCARGQGTPCGSTR